jgi:hypothetical protein
MLSRKIAMNSPATKPLPATVILALGNVDAVLSWTLPCGEDVGMGAGVGGVGMGVGGDVARSAKAGSIAKPTVQPPIPSRQAHIATDQTLQARHHVMSDLVGDRRCEGSCGSHR